MTLDAAVFRQALSQLATGIAVVTAQSWFGQPIGTTISAFNSVSLDPPPVLFGAHRDACSLPCLVDADGYAVDVLNRAQECLSNQFARSLADKWSDVVHSVGHAAASLLDGALATFGCEPCATHDGGGHVILVGRVLRFTSNDNEDPLDFFRGRARDADKSQPLHS